MSVTSRAEAITALDWYAMRWNIETFFKIIKSACKAESSKLRTAARIANLISVFCILSWRIFWITILNRMSTHIAPELALTKIEIKLLDRLVKSKGKLDNKLNTYLTKIAQLGGYLARASDPSPGNFVMWRGLMRLTDIQLGFDLAMQNVGN